MFNNFAGKEESSRTSGLRKYDSDSKDRVEGLSRNYNNTNNLCSIKEDHAQENSATSLLMDKPIRNLRDVYKGIRQEYKDRKKVCNKKKKSNSKQSEETKEEPTDQSYDSDISYDEEDVEMDPSHKKILEDNVIKVITTWNDMEYIKKNNQTFLSPNPKPSAKGKKETPKVEKRASHNECTNLNNSLGKEIRIAKVMKSRSTNKSKRKKIITSDTKFFKSPMAPPVKKQNDMILVDNSNFEAGKGSASEKIFLFSDTKREKPLRKITFNEKMRKMKMLSDSKAYYQGPSNLNNRIFHRDNNRNKISVNKTFMLEKQKPIKEKHSMHKAYSETK